MFFVLYKKPEEVLKKNRFIGNPTKSCHSQAQTQPALDKPRVTFIYKVSLLKPWVKQRQPMARFVVGPQGSQDTVVDDKTKEPVVAEPISLYPGNGTEGDRIVEQLAFSPPNVSSEPLKILLWQGLNQDVWGGLNPREGDEIFHRESCLVTNCFMTEDRDQLESSDLVLFRETVPQLRKTSGQLWMIFSLESPLHCFIDSPELDWTATYRRDSTIVAPYGAWRPHQTGTERREVEPGNFAENKTSQVVWFVSNCGARNNRLEYAEQLGQHIAVDIYGDCGTKHCARNNPDCGNILRQYKFYLAFENSNCADYITEKFWLQALQNNILPIVMGPSVQDYEAVAPPKSFIHVESFQSPGELAKYLHVLDKDDDLYNEYFAWKTLGDFIDTKFFCRVCSMLHYSRHNENKVVKNIQEWWDGPDICK